MTPKDALSYYMRESEAKLNEVGMVACTFIMGVERAMVASVTGWSSRLPLWEGRFVLYRVNELANANILT